MKIIFKNCNNINQGEIQIEQGKLNIKYGANGTGKSTIATAIERKISNEATLVDLLPFKLRQDNPQNLVPEVDGLAGIGSIRIFNENYLEQFVFKPDELVANSFEIFIKTPDYEQHLQAIEGIVKKTRSAFSEDPDLDLFLTDLRELSGCFKLTAKSEISKASPGYKALERGNKYEHIPKGLEEYEPFLKHEKNISWIGWQQQGQPFLEISHACPFCTLPATAKRETIKRFSEEYDKKTIEHLTKIIGVIEKLGKYFSDEARAKINQIIKQKDGLQKEHTDFLISIKTQIGTLTDKLEQLKSLSGQSFKETEKVAEKLPTLRLDLTFFEHLNSTETQRIIAVLNGKLDELSVDAGRLQGEINKQRKATKKLIEENLSTINGFLANAGYKYEVLITDESDGHRLRLRHVEYTEAVSGGSQHLSFGERNAFALVLFMFECLSKKPDLIVLDDPISSFDKDKKFAILNMLFQDFHSFKGKTVLLLTHDIEPVIDTVKVLKRMFSSISTAHFLKASDGNLTERLITADKMLTFGQICSSVIRSTCPLIIKLIYLRRYFETIDDLGDTYQLLSNLLKGRQTPEDHRRRNLDGSYMPLSAKDTNKGMETIREMLVLPSFDYQNTVSCLADNKFLLTLYRDAKNGYEKLQIYRLIDSTHKNSVIRKYINETYHIENDFICQLAPTEYDQIPQYVIDECDKMIQEVFHKQP